jgi:hypothetical protein
LRFFFFRSSSLELELLESELLSESETAEDESDEESSDEVVDAEDEEDSPR